MSNPACHENKQPRQGQVEFLDGEDQAIVNDLFYTLTSEATTTASPIGRVSVDFLTPDRVSLIHKRAREGAGWAVQKILMLVLAEKMATRGFVKRHMILKEHEAMFAMLNSLKGGGVDQAQKPKPQKPKPQKPKTKKESVAKVEKLANALYAASAAAMLINDNKIDEELLQPKGVILDRIGASLKKFGKLNVDAYMEGPYCLLCCEAKTFAECYPDG